MREISVFNSLTLDGVMQAPGSPDEDRRDGFTQGGWSIPYQDEVMGRIGGRGMAVGADLLLGRFTYENFYSYWPHQTDNPFTEVLNRSRKYVASRTLTEPLPWENSVLLGGNVGEIVGELKRDEGNDIVVLGSGDLLQTLIGHQLVDRYVLLIHPLVLGAGRRMFGEGLHARLELVDVVQSTTGVLIATYTRQNSDQ